MVRMYLTKDSLHSQGVKGARGYERGKKPRREQPLLTQLLVVRTILPSVPIIFHLMRLILERTFLFVIPM